MTKCKNPVNQEVLDLAKSYMLDIKNGTSLEKAGTKVVNAERTGGKIARALGEMFSSAIVSGLPTHAGNFLSGAVVGMSLPMTKAIGKGWRAPREAAADMAQVYNFWRNARIGLKMAGRSVVENRQFLDRSASVVEQNVHGTRAMSSRNFNIDKNAGLGSKIAGNTIDAVGTAYNAVGHRLLSAGEEMFDQMNYRSHVMQKLITNNMRNGFSFMQSQRLAEQGVEEHMAYFYKLGSLDPSTAKPKRVIEHRKLTDEDKVFNKLAEEQNAALKAKLDAKKEVGEELTDAQKEFNKKVDALYKKDSIELVKEKKLTALEDQFNVIAQLHNDRLEMHESGIAYTKDALFKKDLDPEAGYSQKLGHLLQYSAEKVPVLRFTLLPIIRAPMHLLSMSVRNTLGAPLSRSWRLDMAAGGERKDLALGQLTFASISTAAAIPFILDGTIQGSISGDYRVQNNADNAGKQHTSIRVSDGKGGYETITYNYMEPYAHNLSVWADAINSMKREGIEWEDLDTLPEAISMVDDLAVHIAKSNVHAIYNKTYFTTFKDAIKTLEDYGDPESGGEGVVRMLRQMAGGFVPNLISQANRALIDETRRETIGVLDGIKSQIPIWSKTLSERRDTLGFPKRFDARFYGAFPFKNKKLLSAEAENQRERVLVEIGRVAIKTDRPIRDLNPRISGNELDTREFFPNDEVGLPATASFHGAWNNAIMDSDMVLDLASLIDSKSYKELEDEVQQEILRINPLYVAGSKGSLQQNLIRDIISNYRNEARDELLRQPEWARLRKQVEILKETKIILN